MLDPTTIDFRTLGFHAGLEVHHQIQSTRKLFCHCIPQMVPNSMPPDYRFERYFRPVLGEMGDFDPGMLIEYEKGYRVIYNAYEAMDCIYEQDEQPPMWPDQGALMRGYELAYWLNCTALVDEIIFARKQYLDGSITTGFQRTTIVARDGWVEVDGKKVAITNITVEEDSARKIKTENYGRTVYYNLDRLGIPLVEVITDHNDVETPQELLKTAQTIGLVLRESGIGKRGIGTARQDVNISIAGGDRVELKGVQDLDLFEKYCSHEVCRQDSLIRIAAEMKARGLTKQAFEHTYIDLSDLFSAIPEKKIVMGIRLPKMAGILGEEEQPGKDFGQDVLEKASLISGVPMIHLFHSDELTSTAFRKMRGKSQPETNSNNISETNSNCNSETSSDTNSKTGSETDPETDSETKSGTSVESNYFFERMTAPLNAEIRNTMQLSLEDAYVLVMASQKWAIHTVKKVIERIKMAFDGVPQETRRALPDGNSEFLRVIHGKERLYPDTDTPVIDMDMVAVEKLSEKVGRRPWEYEEIYGKQYGLNFDQIGLLIRHSHTQLFEKLVQDYKIDPLRVYQCVEDIFTSLRRENIDGNSLPEEKLAAILMGAQKGQYDWGIIRDLIISQINHPNMTLSEILLGLGVHTIDSNDLEKLYKEATEVYHVYEERMVNHHNFSPESKLQHKIDQITGIIMRKINHGYSGKQVAQFVQEQIKA